MVRCAQGDPIAATVAVLCAGAASSSLLSFEGDAPAAGAQTAYGFEIEMEAREGEGEGEGEGVCEDGYPFDRDAMHFMDFRRHHTGLWGDRALHPQTRRALGQEGAWGCAREAPSFLYAMPLGNGRAFFQETCLVAKQAVPFTILRRRLLSRMDALGVRVKRVVDEEWSYIPVGGPVPDATQRTLAFGAAANMIHPASGYSLAHSLNAAPTFARTIAELHARERERDSPGGWSAEASAEAWEALWSHEQRKQAAFNTFGMELLAVLDVGSVNDFFLAFFSLPDWMWKGFLSCTLGSNQLLAFALAMFAVSPVTMKARLVGHLISHPAGKYVVGRYLGLEGEGPNTQHQA